MNSGSWSSTDTPVDASDGMLGGTTSSELLAYYKKRCEDFESSEAETLQYLKDIEAGHEDLHKARWDLRVRREEVTELQKALSDATRSLSQASTPEAAFSLLLHHAKILCMAGGALLYVHHPETCCMRRYKNNLSPEDDHGASQLQSQSWDAAATTAALKCTEEDSELPVLTSSIVGSAITEGLATSVLVHRSLEDDEVQS